MGLPKLFFSRQREGIVLERGEKQWYYASVEEHRSKNIPKNGPSNALNMTSDSLKVKTSNGHAIALWKKRCGIDQKRSII